MRFYNVVFYKAGKSVDARCFTDGIGNDDWLGPGSAEERMNRYIERAIASNGNYFDRYEIQQEVI